MPEGLNIAEVDFSARTFVDSFAEAHWISLGNLVSSSKFRTDTDLK